jgi:gamma-D-glutamyl-L-lysine dipeptidyl-peptidase
LEAQCGDLLFFGKSVNNAICIVHVGICLGDGEFIHATVAQNRPFVRISSIRDPLWNGGNPDYPYAACRRTAI